MIKTIQEDYPSNFESKVNELVAEGWRVESTAILPNPISPYNPVRYYAILIKDSK